MQNEKNQYSKKQAITALVKKGFFGTYANEDISVLTKEVDEFTTIVATVEECKGIATINGVCPKLWYSQIYLKSI